MERINELLLAWSETTGQDLHPRSSERLCWDFLNMGFTPDDLRCVVLHMKALNKKMCGAAFQFRAYKVIGDLEWFGSMLAESRAQQRNRVVRTPAERVLATRTGGVLPTRTGDTSRAAGEVARVALATLRETL